MESEAAESETQQEAAPEDGPLTPYEEPISITCSLQAKATQQFIDGDTWEDNVWTRKYKEALNIDVSDLI